MRYEVKSLPGLAGPIEISTSVAYTNIGLVTISMTVLIHGTVASAPGSRPAMAVHRHAVFTKPASGAGVPVRALYTIEPMM